MNVRYVSLAIVFFVLPIQHARAQGKIEFDSGYPKTAKDINGAIESAGTITLDKDWSIKSKNVTQKVWISGKTASIYETPIAGNKWGPVILASLVSGAEYNVIVEVTVTHVTKGDRVLITKPEKAKAK